ncbi:MAG: glycosyltransferase family 4 protein [Proteobacteria bacterium]|nr:glycosyltransferase family 4 protein [Pseudomonadota bacterium]
MKKPRIAIASAGRFHVLDLARELHALGYEVRFYSYVPRRRAMAFGLPAECHVSLVSRLLPLLAWQVKAPGILPKLRERLLWAAMNRAVMARLQPCDVFICMSGMYLEAAEYAKKRYGAIIELHRGSKHILAQDEILASLPGAERPSRLAIARELAGYRLADMIAIPAQHVLESFSREPSAQAKCVVNPYGVDLNQFPLWPRSAPKDEVVFVYAGVWSYQKGCNLLAAAVQQVDHIRLIHVGALGDCPFPIGNQKIQHVRKIDQADLSEIYRGVDAFVLASRQEGLGMVLGQALASGLPVVCTSETGGRDLCHTPALRDRVHVIPSGNVESLAQGMAHLAERLRHGPPFTRLCDEDRQTLSWAAYGLRYAESMYQNLATRIPH